MNWLAWVIVGATVYVGLAAIVLPPMGRRLRYDQRVDTRLSMNVTLSVDEHEWLRHRAKREHRTIAGLGAHLFRTALEHERARDPGPTPVAPDGATPGQIRTDEAT